LLTTLTLVLTKAALGVLAPDTEINNCVAMFDFLEYLSYLSTFN
jgi:hypothetical protein